MLIEITQEHIDKGERLSSQRCAMALAIKDSLGHNKVVVGISHAIIDYPDNLYKLPPRAEEFVERFDSGLPVQPFGFELVK